MSNENNIINSQEMLERLSRQGSQDSTEISVVTSPGAKATAWVIRVESLSSYNVYNVCVVEILSPGALPVGIGGEMKAFNVAESFHNTGTLSAGAYAIMFKVGEKNVFYVTV